MENFEIIKLAQNIKIKFGNNPIHICNELGIKINYMNLNPKSYKAYTLAISDNPVISINNNFTETSQKVLCAHELGHALMHKNKTINQFEDINNGIFEYEANLFAVSLLFDTNDFNLDILNMDNYILKSILDYNLFLKSEV
ncbi:MAG: ImmA/IrrE family metallo-endopeptidase [Clostridium perfringens]|nr:ImmA/IrrE family metallo-endopeptidase [Clostridium perfringens]